MAPGNAKQMVERSSFYLFGGVPCRNDWTVRPPKYWIARGVQICKCEVNKRLILHVRCISFAVELGNQHSVACGPFLMHPLKDGICDVLPFGSAEALGQSFPEFAHCALRYGGAQMNNSGLTLKWAASLRMCAP